MLGAAREMQRVLPGLTVDAKVSRSMSAALEVVRQRSKAGPFGQFVVVDVGNNGYLQPEQFDELLQLLSAVPRVIVFNLKEPRSWETVNNQIIADTVRRYPNAVLIDWRSVSLAHPEFFGRDGIHLGLVAARVYTQLIAEQVRPLLSRSPLP